MEIHTTTLPQRLQECVKRAGGKRNLAKLCHISEPQLFRYLRGASIPRLSKLEEIAKTVKVDFNWLTSGEGEIETPAIKSLKSENLTIPHYELFEEACILIETALSDFNLHVTPKLKAQLSLYFYKCMLNYIALYEEPPNFRVGKALEHIALIQSTHSEIARGFIFQSDTIFVKAKKGLLPSTELKSFVNSLCHSSISWFSEPTSKLYFERLGQLDDDETREMDVFMENILPHLSSKMNPIRVLDVGCGNGRYLEYFAKNKLYQAVGVEANEYAFHLVKNLMERYPKARVEKADFRNLPFADESFDFLYCVHILAYLPYIPGSGLGVEQAFKEIQRVLSVNGLCYICARYGKGYDMSGIAQLFTEEDIDILAKANGLLIINREKVLADESIKDLPKAGTNRSIRLLLQKVA
jgi:SAM-dependent methyltransferase/transcriptional regulator with XRE-family HTH domain